MADTIIKAMIQGSRARNAFNSLTTLGFLVVFPVVAVVFAVVVVVIGGVLVVVVVGLV